MDHDGLLSRFDPEVKAELMQRLDADRIDEEHIVELYRLISTSPEERDIDSICELLDAVEGMEGDEFKKWVDDRIERWREK
jgi:hypothetical protein